MSLLKRRPIDGFHKDISTHTLFSQKYVMGVNNLISFINGNKAILFQSWKRPRHCIFPQPATDQTR